MNKIDLYSLLKKNAGNDFLGKWETQHAEQLLHGGLELLLRYLVAITTSAAIREESVPSGISGEFVKVHELSTESKQLNYLYWLKSRSKHPATESIRLFLTDQQKDNQAPLASLVNLRNRMHHSQGETTEEIKESIIECCNKLTTLADIGELHMNDDTAYWSYDGSSVKVSPLIIFRCGNFIAYKSYEYPYGLIINDNKASGVFHEEWKRVRLNDRSLVLPTSEEFHFRAAKLTQQVVKKTSSPRWINSLFKRGAPGLLIDEVLLDSIQGYIHQVMPETSLLAIAVADDDIPLETIARMVHLKNTPSFRDFSDFAQEDSPIVIIMDVRDASVRTFLNIMYWLMDIIETDNYRWIRVCVCRYRNTLKTDYDTLWDRLPADLWTMFRTPEKKAYTFSDIVWHENTRISPVRTRLRKVLT